MGRLDGFDYYHEDSDDEGSESEDESQFTSPNHTDPCRKYPMYVYLLMTEYNMLTNAFQSIGLAYKYLLTLLVTQVACERAFSILKIIKTRLRNLLVQSNLETFMLMMVEHDISLTIDKEYIIDQVASFSQAYARILKRR